jgi:hypothetical protein
MEPAGTISDQKMRDMVRKMELDAAASRDAASSAHCVKEGSAQRGRRQVNKAPAETPGSDQEALICEDVCQTIAQTGNR